MTEARLEPGPPKAAQRRRPEAAAAPPPSLPETPYKGLSYYSEEDAPFFFGRERETRVVTANLMALRLTLLYGESGVGKSSLLRAGVARHVRELALDNMARRGSPQLVPVLFPGEDAAGGRASWRDDPVPSLLNAVEHAVEALGLDVEPPSRDLPFDDVLAEWTTRLHSDLLIVLDQFEEYLLYHEAEDGEGTLAAELPRALARAGLRVSFLVSIREDALAKLDRFKTRIPNLFDNYLRISHLDRAGARDAITKPIEKWNALSGADPRYAVEPELVQALLDQLRAGRVLLGVVGAGASALRDSDGDGEQRVETPYLQLVVTRLWKEELASGSRTLRLATLERLGGSDRIVKTHLDDTMRRLPRYDRYVAARVFHYLVTPSGTKVAHSARDLAAYVGLAEADVEPVLDQLSGGDFRIVRPVTSEEGDRTPTRYEIFHDVLAAPILDWRARYLRAREAVQSARRGATLVLHLAIGFVWFLCLLVAVSDAYTWSGATRVLFGAWFAGALVMWGSATWVLRRRWRRRSAWVVPVVGVVASALALVSVAILAASGALRLWRWVSRRAPFPARARPVATQPVSRLRTWLQRDRVRSFSAFVALIGGGVLAVAWLLPLYDVSEWAPDASGFWAGNTATVRIVDLGWQALVPVATTALVALTTLFGLGRARERGFASGFLATFGLSALTWFLVLGFAYDVTPRYGAALGAVGSGFILVAAARESVLENFAAILGVGRMLPDRGRTRTRALARGAEWRRRARVGGGAVAFLGASLVFAAAFAPYHSDGASLADVSGAAAFRPIVPALAAAAVAFAVLVRPLRRRLAAGTLAGAGAAALLLYAGGILADLGVHEFGYADVGRTDDLYRGVGLTYGAYLGAAGASVLLAVAIALVPPRLPRGMRRNHRGAAATPAET